jgi:hypothetical protein
MAFAQVWNTEIDFSDVQKREFDCFDLRRMFDWHSIDLGFKRCAKT